MAEREVRDLIRPQEPKRVKIEDIQRVVARQYNVSRSDLLSSRRTANVVRPRQVAMYLAKTLTLRSLPEIGRRFGGRDHTTVLHAVRKIEGLVGSDMALAEEIEILKRQLQEYNLSGALRRDAPLLLGVRVFERGGWPPPLGKAAAQAPSPLRFSRQRVTFAVRPRIPRTAGLPVRPGSWGLKAPKRVFP
jgi:hypothetical protein